MFNAATKSGNSGGGYTINNSLRFRASASPTLTRTFTTATDAKKCTLSFWCKRGGLGAGVYAFWATNSYPNYDYFSFNGDAIALVINGTLVTTSSVFRDPSSWYHVVISLDTTQATATDRAKIYVNGVQQTVSYSGTITQNASLASNSAYSHNISNLVITGYGPYSYYFDGYLAEYYFIDGQALTPSSFGSINSTTGIWRPIRYSGTYGTNGFYLPFNSGTSLTIGYDSSGNNNNFAASNFSSTSGATYDWMLDSPTSYAGTSYGVGNYAVLNPIAPVHSTLLNANLSTNGGDGYSLSTIGVTSGKWYAEMTVTTVGTESSCGLANAFPSTFSASSFVGSTSFTWGYYSVNGNKYNNTSPTAYGSTYTSGDLIGIAFDADAGTLTFYKNNVSQGTAFTGLTSGPYYFAISGRTSGTPNNCSINFGQRPFAYTPPTGYKSLCTFNLPTPTIQNGANYMAATLWTGDGATTRTLVNTVNGVSFQPDLVWVKERSSTAWNVLCDSVRGANKGLYSNSTNQEEALTNTLQSFDSNGFTVAYNSAYASVFTNRSTQTYVGWQWKAGGTAVTNTTGSINSQVSANPTAGFSVVAYTGTGVNATVGHGLGVAPSFIIVKNRITAGYDWLCYHASLNATNFIALNTTAATGAGVTVWNNTAPTSSVFSVSTSGNVNESTKGIVAYCFAAIPGFSAFGSYTGNGSADGPFVWTGFRPKFVLIKGTSSSSWYMWDSSRGAYNVINETLNPNLSNAEGGSGGIIDFLSNGFKIRTTGTDLNTNGNTMVYACFAENPFNYSLAR